MSIRNQKQRNYTENYDLTTICWFVIGCLSLKQCSFKCTIISVFRLLIFQHLVSPLLEKSKVKSKRRMI